MHPPTLARDVSPPSPTSVVGDGGSTLTNNSVREHEARFLRALSGEGARVKAYTASGEQVGLAGLGDGTDRLTFPPQWKVADVLNNMYWIRFATEEEKNAGGAWWRAAAVQPWAVLHEGGILAMPGEPIGLFGDSVTVLAQCPQPFSHRM